MDRTPPDLGGLTLGYEPSIHDRRHRGAGVPLLIEDGRPISVLVAEDDRLLGSLLAEMLADQGWLVTGPFSDAADAAHAATVADVDVGLLDVVFGAERALGPADALSRRGIPIVFASGMPRTILEGLHRDALWLDKPFDEAALVAIINSACGGPSRVPVARMPGEDRMPIATIPRTVDP